MVYSHTGLDPFTEKTHASAHYRGRFKRVGGGRKPPVPNTRAQYQSRNARALPRSESASNARKPAHRAAADSLTTRHFIKRSTDLMSRIGSLCLRLSHLRVLEISNDKFPRDMMVIRMSTYMTIFYWGKFCRSTWRCSSGSQRLLASYQLSSEVLAPSVPCFPRLSLLIILFQSIQKRGIA